MRRIFTLFSALFFLALTQQGNSQTCTVPGTCPGTTEDFSDNASNFTGTGFSYDAADDRFEGSFDRNTGGSVTSAGFIPSGSLITIKGEFTGAAGSVSVELLDANGTVLVTCATTTPTTNSTTPVCRTFSGLTPGTTYKVRFTFTRGGTGSTNAVIVEFDNFGIDPSNTALPVTFISFNAEKLSNSTKLTWKVGVEENLKGYEIEKSTDGRQFTSVGFVPANGQATYTFTDAQTNQGPVFYRIRNVDIDGKFKYSNILSLKNGASSLVLRAFPLPAINKLTIQHEAVFNNGGININTTDGRVVKGIIPAKGSLETIVNLSGLKSGVYVLVFDSGNGKLQTMKFMKQ